MRFLPLSCSSIYIGATVASPVVKHDDSDYSQVIRNQLSKRQNVGIVPGLNSTIAGFVPVIANMGILPNIVKSINSGYGKIADIPGAASKRIELKTRTPHIQNSKTIKIRYGPYKVPTAARKNMLGESGTLFNYPELDVERPCKGECILLSMEADLEYADGSNANTSNGMWLHHMVLFNVGPNRFDPTCIGKTSLPHSLISSSPAKAERVMASGNERTRARFNSPYQPNEKLGYFLNPTDTFSLILDFMNEKPEDRIVYLTMKYDYVEGRPEGFSNFRTIWLDVAQCGTSEIRPPVQSGRFNLSQVWEANLNADILGAGGHLHDGGTNVTLIVDGKQVCNSVATYGLTNGTKGAGSMGSMGMGGAGMARSVSCSLEGLLDLEKRDGPHLNGEHISAMSPCTGANMTVSQVRIGQKWIITSYYDYDKYSGMKMNGQQSSVMGIVLMMVKNWSA